MTLAAVWKVGERVYAIADTRIIRSPGNVLTEHGPKLLPVNMVCKQPGVSGFFDRIAYRTSFGFAYAGASLSALSTPRIRKYLMPKSRRPRWGGTGRSRRISYRN
jgi:hypothetical protein